MSKWCFVARRFVGVCVCVCVAVGGDAVIDAVVQEYD